MVNSPLRGSRPTTRLRLLGPERMFTTARAVQAPEVGGGKGLDSAPAACVPEAAPAGKLTAPSANAAQATLAMTILTDFTMIPPEGIARRAFQTLVRCGCHDLR
jgi:hypothetical protein